MGHKVLSSVEHGWQSNYYVPYEITKEYDLKFVFGTEAYWVKDRFEKDNSNHHIIILARNESGRQAINDVLGEANITGYYYRPRLDLSLLLSLPSKDVFLTSACIAFWKEEKIDEIVCRLHDHFKENFMLEVQNHNTPEQINLNKKILELSSQQDIELIAGLDSHYIYPNEAAIRDDALKSKGIVYEGESGWYMDYPDDQTVIQRFLDQKVLSKDQIDQAMNNTDILLDFDDFEFNEEVKLPTLYPEKTQEEKNKIYSKLISKKFNKYMSNVPKERYKEYYDGVKKEVDVYKKTNMVDYPLINYQIINEALKNGGLITNTGRGSAVGFFTNTLCGFSSIDRFQAEIKIYPERFISESRILKTRSLPDIDFNVGNVEVFEEAQKKVLGEEHVYPMIAFGTFGKKAAFKLYAKSQNLDFSLASEISDQIGKYEKALKYADDDEREELNIYDFVDQKYHDYIRQSEPYFGIISDKKKAPSAYLLYQGNIRKEIGIIKCKSESTRKEYITTVIDGKVAEEYKFLKNDLLTVDVVTLINKIYQRVGIKSHSARELIELVKKDLRVWGIYAKGLTVGINQCEKPATTEKVMRYKPRTVAELATFIAAIRPGFKSMYPIFEKREPFSYGVPTLDKLLSTKEAPIPFMIFQEQTMNILNYAGFPIDECYSIVKAIAKKHSEKVRPLKDKFIKGFAERIKNDDRVNDTKSNEMSLKVWKIIEDNSNYSFNSAHAYCMAIDSLYCAWLKVNHPYEFYEVLLQHYSEKGDKDKVVLIKKEMEVGFGIKEGDYKWGKDNRSFVADPANHCINPSLLSLKKMNQTCANVLYDLSLKKDYSSFCDLLADLKINKGIHNDKIERLIQIDYFSEFGDIGFLLKQLSLFDKIYERKQIKKEDLSKLGISLEIMEKHSGKATDKLYKDFNALELLKDVVESMTYEKVSLIDKLKYELDCFGFIKTKVEKANIQYAIVVGIERKYQNPVATLCRLKTKDIEHIKIKIKDYKANEFKVGDIIKTIECTESHKWGRDENGEWYRKDETEPFLSKWSLVR